MTNDPQRRDFIRSVGVLAAAASAASLIEPAAAQGTQPGAKAMNYQAKPMSFDPKAISGISEKVLVSHYENNYVGAVKRLNLIEEQLAGFDFNKAPDFSSTASSASN